MEGDLENADRAPALFDPQSLLERCMGDAAAAGELLKMFHGRLPGCMAEISAGLSSGDDLPGMIRKVHTLKGNAGNLSAGRLYLAAARLEQALRNGELADVAPLLARLQREADGLMRALPGEMGALAASLEMSGTH